MLRHSLTFAFAAVLFPLAMTDVSASAQRTFVSSEGSPGNAAFNCSLTKPCRAFSEAMSVTNTDGEIIVLDSAGYGPVAIDKPVSITAPAGVYAGVTVFTGHGIDVIPPNGNVSLRGLTINGLGGDIGINFISGTTLYVEDCIVSGFSSAGLVANTPASGAKLVVFVRHSIFRDNLDGAVLGTNTSATGLVETHIEGCTFQNNTGRGVGFMGSYGVGTVVDTLMVGNNWGLGVNPTTNPATLYIEARNVTIAKNTTSGATVGFWGPIAVLHLISSQVTSNGIGIESLFNGTVYVTDTAITGNTTGVAADPGVVISIGDNRLVNNSTNGTFTSTVPKQ